MLKLFNKKYLKIKLRKYIYYYLSLKKNVHQKFFLPRDIKNKLNNNELLKVNLCSGPEIIKNYVNIDIQGNADIILDLKKNLIPLPNNSTKYLVCMSAINYFNFTQAENLISEIFRIMSPGGIVRFGVQDLKLLSEKYLNKNYKFYFQSIPNASFRFPGETFAMKFNHFFNAYGHKTVFDYETLKYFLKKKGFEKFSNNEFQISKIPNIEIFDNRPEMFFYLECEKEDYKIYFDLAKKNIKQKKFNIAWQHLIKCIDLNISDSSVINLALNIMDSNNCHQHAILLINDYIKETGDKKTFNVKSQYFKKKISLKNNNELKNHLMRKFNVI